MLIALIKKDIHICRLPIIAGIVLLLGPFAMAAAMIWNTPLWMEATPAAAWATLLGTGCYFSVMCSQPTLAMISGNIIAAERADHSAEFLAYLPPSKRQILGSKLIVIVTTVAIVWGFNLVVGLVAYGLAGETNAARTMTSDFGPLRYAAAIGFAFIGAGWCVSAMSESTGPAVAFAFSAPLVVLAGLMSIQYLTEWPSALDFIRVYFTGCVVFGVVLFTLGTVYFLRRTEP